MYLYSAHEMPPVTRKVEPVKKSDLLVKMLLPFSLAFLGIPVYLMVVLKFISLFQ